MALPNAPLLSHATEKNNKCLPCKLALTFTAVAAVCFFYLSSPHLDANLLNHASKLCTRSPDRSSCITVVSDAISGVSRPTTVATFHAVLDKSRSKLEVAVSDTERLLGRGNQPEEQSALADCLHLMDLSADHLAAAVTARDDTRMWLSAALANHVTCRDGLGERVPPEVDAHLRDLMALTSASLAVLNAIDDHWDHDGDLEPLVQFPVWLSRRDHKLLEASSASAIQANAVVAKDGSGKYKTVQAAVDASPNKGSARYVIYVKKGVYKETVRINKMKTNLMILGDGMDSTVITGRLNFIDGTTTFNSATLDFGIISEDQLLRSTYTCLNRVLIDQERATQAILQVRQFHARFGSMGTQSALRAAQSADPVEWWYAFGLDVPELREAAVRILCQTTSSSGCERNWSTFDLIHTKRRNRLQNKRLNDLVFVHYNSRLQERNKRTHRKIMNMDPINLSTFFIDDPLEDWLQEEQPIDLNQEDVDTILSREENIEAEENIDNNPPPPPPEESIDIPSGYNDNAYVPSSWNVPEVDEQDFVPEAFYNYDFTQFSLDENMNFQLPTSHGYVDTGGGGGRYGGPFGGQDGIPHGHRSGGSSSFGGESSSGYAGGSSGDGRGTGGGDGSDTWFSGGYNYPTGWEQQH